MNRRTTRHAAPSGWPHPVRTGDGLPSFDLVPAPLAGVAAVGAVLLTVVGLVALGRHGLAGPTDWSASGLCAWADGRDPVVVAMGLVRLGALGVAAHVLAVGLLGLVGTIAHLPAVVHLADLISLPGLRGLTRRIAGLGLSAVSVLAPATGPVRSASAPVLATRLAEPDPSTASITRIDRSGDRADTASTSTEVTMVRVDPAPPTTSAPPAMERVDDTETAAPSAPDPTAAAATGPATPDHPRRTWTVRHGDHLWSIAHTTLAEAWDRPPTEAETDRYWRSVLQANASLADPDLIFAGQVIRLPEVPTP